MKYDKKDKKAKGTKKVDYTKIAFGSDIPYYEIDLALEGVILFR